MELSEVRQKIDQVDEEIRRLFLERMKLADQVACIKAETDDVIYKPDREEAIIQHHTEGVSERLVKEYTALIKRIMEVSRKYQYGRTMELRACFPYVYERTAPVIRRPAMKKQELYICEPYSKDDVVTVDSYEDIARCLLEGRADAGMGVIEEVGVGVSDELHRLLTDYGFYIRECLVREDSGIRRKLVTFGRQLVVLPEHNRVKIMFECPNKSGSISSILSMISDYGVNLTEIHSCPFQRGQDWNYMFFVEMNTNIDTKESRAMLYQLSQETAKLQILGSYYCEGDF